MKKLSQSIKSAICSEGVSIWLDARLILTGTIIFDLVALTCFIFILANIRFDFSTMAMTFTYSLTFIKCCSNMILFYSMTEKNIISVERIR